jgi:1-acyl-sn-glycerol-3-phosphate acyltransferase
MPPSEDLGGVPPRDHSSSAVPAVVLGYRAVRWLLDLLLGLFYRRVEVVGGERIPATGPLLVAANHQNALVDPMVLLATMPRPLVTLAKAPLFRNPMIGPFLRLLGAIPVQRRQDAPDEAISNEEMFQSAITTLREGGAILIFPEGVSQPEPTLMPLRTGAARIVLAAEAAAGGSLGVQLVPVGLVYHDPGTFRTGWAVVAVGEPLDLADCVALYARDPAEAVRQLTLRLAEGLSRLIVETGDRQTLRLLEVAESIWRAESPELARDPAARAAWRQRTVRAYRYLIEREPGRIASLRGELEEYAKMVEMIGLEGRAPGERAPLVVATRYTVREGLALLLGFPLAVLGLALHAFPYQFTAWAIRLVDPEADAEATFKIAGGLLFFVACWAVEGWLVWRFWGFWAFALFLVALAPTGFFALGWADRLARVGREARHYLRFLADRNLARLLVERRRAIMAELVALLRLVPTPVLEGAAPEPRAERG